MAKHAWLAIRDEEYNLLGVKRGKPELWEDGLRTCGAKGSYEWWYFDSKFSDGSSLVIVFFTGPMISFSEGFKPHATFTLTYPDGTRVYDMAPCSADEAIFSKDKCDIKIGDCTCKGNMTDYEIYWNHGGIEATLKLNSNVPSWRPQTGHILFDDKDIFAWLPSVPEGGVEVTMTRDGKTESFSGTGYHDHNWGNTPMFRLMHHWYWGRAKIGDYQVVSSFITATKKYSYDETPVFMLAKDGKILADCPEKYLTYREENVFFDSITKKHVAGRLVYDYDDGEQHYRITYDREGDLEQIDMKTQVTPLQYAAIWLMGLRGSYHRMFGSATLERFENGEVVETVKSPALWELMYFGKDRITGLEGRI